MLACIKLGALSLAVFLKTQNGSYITKTSTLRSPPSPLLNANETEISEFVHGAIRRSLTDVTTVGYVIDAC